MCRKFFGMRKAQVGSYEVSFAAEKHKNAKKSNKPKLELRVFVHLDRHHADVGKEAEGKVSIVA